MGIRVSKNKKLLLISSYAVERKNGSGKMIGDRPDHYFLFFDGITKKWHHVTLSIDKLFAILKPHLREKSLD